MDLFDAAQPIPGAGIVRIQGDGGVVRAGGFREVGAGVMYIAREAEQGVVIGGESGAHEALRLVGLAAGEKLEDAFGGGAC